MGEAMHVCGPAVYRKSLNLKKINKVFLNIKHEILGHKIINLMMLILNLMKYKEYHLEWKWHIFVICHYSSDSFCS